MYTVNWLRVSWCSPNTDGYLLDLDHKNHIAYNSFIIFGGNKYGIMSNNVRGLCAMADTKVI